MNTQDPMTGLGCGRCGGVGHTSESCPQSKEAAIVEALMDDPYELDDDDLMLDPFEAVTKKKEEDKKTKVKKKVKKAEDVVDKVTDAANWLLGPPKKHHGASNNPGAGPIGTSVDDLVDNVGTGEHAVPVTLITDHKGEVAQGVEPASCRTCGEPMADHAQWNPTHQVGAPPKQASFEMLGWMDVPPEDTRPRRGDLTKEAHEGTYDVSLHDPQSPRIGEHCAFCGEVSNHVFGAVKSYADPKNPVLGKIVAHENHFEEYKASLGNATPTATAVPMADGKGVVINVYASRDEAP